MDGKRIQEIKERVDRARLLARIRADDDCEELLNEVLRLRELLERCLQYVKDNCGEDIRCNYPSHIRLNADIRSALTAEVKRLKEERKTADEITLKAAEKIIALEEANRKLREEVENALQSLSLVMQDGVFDSRKIYEAVDALNRTKEEPCRT